MKSGAYGGSNRDDVCCGSRASVARRAYFNTVIPVHRESEFPEWTKKSGLKIFFFFFFFYKKKVGQRKSQRLLA